MKTMKEYLSSSEGVMQMWEAVNQVLDGFNFGNVKAAMGVLDWSWLCKHEEAERYEDEGCLVVWNAEGAPEGYVKYYPECPQLYQTARDMIINTVRDMPEGKTRWSVSGGGFKVEVRISTDEERADYWGSEVANVDDFAHSVDITLYFIVEESDNN